MFALQLQGDTVCICILFQGGRREREKGWTANANVGEGREEGRGLEQRLATTIIMRGGHSSFGDGGMMKGAFKFKEVLIGHPSSMSTKLSELWAPPHCPHIHATYHATSTL